MTDRQEQPAAPDTSSAPQPRRGRLRRFAMVAAVAGVAGLAGVAAGNAFGGPGFGGHGFMKHGMMGHGFFGGGDLEHITERADRMVRHLAVELDASDEQRDRLRAVVRQAVGDLAPLREQSAKAREKARDLLSEATVDRAAIETFRAEQVALADAFSKRVAQAIGDAADVLTPEQRRNIAEHLDRRGFGGGKRHDRMSR